METRTKDVPSKSDTTSMRSFVQGAVLMTVLMLVLYFSIWHFGVPMDFVHVVVYGTVTILFAHVATGLTNEELDLVRTAFVANIVFTAFAVVSATFALNKLTIPFGNVILAVLAFYMTVLHVKMSGLAMNRAVPILIVQDVVLASGLYGLYCLI